MRGACPAPYRAPIVAGRARGPSDRKRRAPGAIKESSAAAARGQVRFEIDLRGWRVAGAQSATCEPAGRRRRFAPNKLHHHSNQAAKRSPLLSSLGCSASERASWLCIFIFPLCHEPSRRARPAYHRNNNASQLKNETKRNGRKRALSADPFRLSAGWSGASLPGAQC